MAFYRSRFTGYNIFKACPSKACASSDPGFLDKQIWSLGAQPRGSSNASSAYAGYTGAIKDGCVSVKAQRTDASTLGESGVSHVALLVLCLLVAASTSCMGS